MREVFSPEPQSIADYACQTGENPLWHSLEKRLYWCDIPNGRIFRFDPSTGNHEQCYEGRTVGGFRLKTQVRGLPEFFFRVRAPSVLATESASVSEEKTNSPRGTNESDRS